MKNLIKSKHSTELDTATEKSSRWFRVGSQRGEIEQLFDLYWGGKERRITGMTLRIIGVNLIALITLLIGMVYLGQYQETLIESKLKRFETEVLLFGAAIAGKASVEGEVYTDKNRGAPLQKTQEMVFTLSQTLNNRVLMFDVDDHLLLDTDFVPEEIKAKAFFKVDRPDMTRAKWNSLEILKNMALFIVSFIPRSDPVPPFHGVFSDNGRDYPDVVQAKRNALSMSAWRSKNDDIILTAAVPIVTEHGWTGTVLIVNENEDIRADMGRVWLNILNIFWLTLAITIFLSIYLSGVIARPLRKLANVAENVRRGKAKHTDIPDMSDRHDEIGELSIVLRDMTHALWDRMDSIESFAADVSHEIKNPLTSLKSAVETASIVKKEEDREKLLGIIRHDIERLDRLITDISNASRLDSELSREMFRIVDLKSVLHQIIDAYKSPLERDAGDPGNSTEALKDGVLITLDMPDHMPEINVRGSEGRLIQVFQNILSNALSFAPIKSTIRIMVEVNDNRVSVSIEDEGKGIPDNKLKTVFERFYSERPQHEEYGRHSGLGLSICKQIITAHGGLIFAENYHDRKGEVKGARFIVILNLV